MTDFQIPSHNDLVRIEREARRMQAETIASGIRALVRRAGHLPAVIGGLMARRAHG